MSVDLADAAPRNEGGSTVIDLKELMMILDLHRQGLSITAIARRLGMDRKTVRKYVTRGLEPPAYGPRFERPRASDALLPFLRERVAAYPGLSAVRLWRDCKERGFEGAYTAIKRAVATIRPTLPLPFEVRFETPPSLQAQVNLARFEVAFTDEPSIRRIVWLFSLVLGHSRMMWVRFVVHQDLGSVLRSHMAAFADLGGVPREVLYDRMKTAVVGEDPDGLVVYNRRATGHAPKGWNAYWMRNSVRTLDILQSLGFTYHIDEPSRDEPFIVPLKDGDFVTVPYTFHMNDIVSFPFVGWNASAYEQALRDEFDQLYEEGATRRRMMVVSLHDRISGHANRVRVLDRFLAYAKSKPGVWFARKDEIAAWALERGGLANSDSGISGKPA